MNKTFTRIDLIQIFIDKLKAERYLEIGVASGAVLLEVRCRHKIGVDPKFRIKNRKRITRNLLYKLFREGIFLNQVTSDQFFNTHKAYLHEKPPQVIFIDGLHTFKQTLKDVHNSLNWLDKGGVIVLHDCNPPHKASATPALSIPEAKRNYQSENDNGAWTGEWCGDVWKVIPYLIQNHPDLNVCVLDADYGLGIISRKIPSLSPCYYCLSDEMHGMDEFQSLDYDDLMANRTEWLNLEKLANLQGVVELHTCQK